MRPAAPSRPAPPPISPYLAEFIGVMILLGVGLTAVTIDFATASPVPGWIPDPLLRRLITGSIFAGTGTLVVYSVLGRISGAHLNPAMTLAFLRAGKVRPRTAAGYVLAQVAGALAGAALVRLAWGGLATSVDVGATRPGTSGSVVAFVAEAIMTFLLVTLVMRMVGTPRLARYTGLAAGVLVAFLVTVEAPISGTSLNPARSLGPAIVAGVYADLWVYLIAPIAGALAAVWVSMRTDRPVPCAKLYHTDEFDCHFAACAYRARARVPIIDRHAGRPDPQPQEAAS
jgi:aquaporin Z